MRKREGAERSRDGEGEEARGAGGQQPPCVDDEGHVLFGELCLAVHKKKKENSGLPFEFLLPLLANLI